MYLNNLHEKIANLLDEYDHANSESGIDTILETWEENKANLLGTLRRHPNWDEDNYRIVFSSNYNRPIDRDAVREVCYWIRQQIVDVMREKEQKIDGLTYGETRGRYRIVDEIIDSINNLQEYGLSILVDGKRLQEYKIELYLLRIALDDFDYMYESVAGRIYVSKQDAKEFEGADKILDLVKAASSNEVNEEIEDAFREYFPSIRAARGTRIIKVIRKLCIHFGIDKVVDVQDCGHLDANGNWVSRMKDMGYNYQIAKLGDAINPLMYTRHTIISVNPLDYLTMSFGHKWASCHTIDKANKRNCDNSYQGQYCSGTLSYMLDPSTVIFYTVDEAYNGNAFETQDKINRCTFHINKDGSVIVQGRVYPDGRDGGDQGLSAQFRNVMQQIIAECFDIPNFWTLKKGTDEIRPLVYSCGTHYKDYYHYADCTVSICKGFGSRAIVPIGHDPICPYCGETHNDSEWLCCEDCRDDEPYAVCERCGARIDEDDDYIHCQDNDCYYCDSECAERDDVHYCVDDENWHTESNCRYDDYENVWYYNTDEGFWMEDGNWYHNYDTAVRAGYAEDDNCCWWPEDEVAYDEVREISFHIDDDTVHIDEKYFIDAESAREGGYIDVDGEWYSTDEVHEDGHTGELFHEDDDTIETDDEVYFISDANAEAEGYRYVDGEWTKENEMEVAA